VPRASARRRQPRSCCTARGRDGRDSARMRALPLALRPLAARWGDLADEVLRPLRLPRVRPDDTLRPVRPAQRPGSGPEPLPRRGGASAPRGLAAHSCLRLESAGQRLLRLVLGASGARRRMAVVRGGSQRLADALRAHLESLEDRSSRARRSPPSTNCGTRGPSCAT
jgi:hypothetical protein